MRLICVASGFILAVLGLALAGSSAVDAQVKTKPKEMKVKVGDMAPSFESTDDMGKPFKSADIVGKKIVVLYFYPADFTGGCTAQACGFRDDIEKLDSKGIAVIGVSGDSVNTHKLFKAHHKLPFTLLADEKGEVAKAFGVPVGKGGVAKGAGVNEKGEKFDVERGATISRWTVVIDKAGKVAAIDEVKKAGDDAKRVAELVKKLEK
jgi:peroxiredoxin Q/BCP